MSPNSTFEFELQKLMFPDARAFGVTDESTIDSRVEAFLSDNHFAATIDETGMLSGRVSKNEFDWEVQQTKPAEYRIKRFGWKLDTTLRLEIENGKITGSYVRPRSKLDWSIHGTYVSDIVTIEIDAPLTLGVVLNGTFIRN